MDELRGERLMDGGWWKFASCRSADPDLFFPVSGAGPSLEQAAEAKAICADCPVREECLTYAVFTGQRHGVWGGLTEQERHATFRRTLGSSGRAHTGDSQAAS